MEEGVAANVAEKAYLTTLGMTAVLFV